MLIYSRGVHENAFDCLQTMCVCVFDRLFDAGIIVVVVIAWNVLTAQLNKFLACCKRARARAHAGDISLSRSLTKSSTFIIACCDNIFNVLVLCLLAYFAAHNFFVFSAMCRSLSFSVKVECELSCVESNIYLKSHVYKE